MGTLFHDFRYGIRMLLKKPGFSVMAVVVLALGIGANAAMFSLVNAFLLKPLVVQKPEELAGVYSRNTRKPDSYRAFSYPNYADLRDKNTVFSSLMAHNLAMVGLADGDSTRRVFADIVSSNYFGTFGVPLYRGRTFTAAEERPGSAIPVVIVSYSYWKKTGADPDLIGKTLRINARIYTVVGIAPQGFTGTTALISAELYAPLGMYEALINDFAGRGRPLAARDNAGLILVARLRPGVTEKAADSQLGGVASQMEQAWPAENKDQTFIVRPLSRLGVSTNPINDRQLLVPAALLLSLAAVVLLIASLNVANMMLARGTARRKEIAIRLSLGGGRKNILQQLLAEGLVLAFFGGAAGLAVSYWSTDLLVRSMSRLAPIDLVYSAGPDLRVLAATMGFCLLSTLLFGLMPAWNLSRPNVLSDLKDGESGDTAGKPRRLFSRRNVLVMSQISLSLMLLTAAGLFIRSSLRAADVDPGFRLDNGVLIEVDPSLGGYDEAHGRQVYRALLDRLRTIPGVQSASVAATVPFGMISIGRDIQRSTDANKSATVAGRINMVGEDYFQTLGIPLLLGRPFDRREEGNGSTVRVAILDKSAADRLWPKGGAVGQHIRLSTSDGRETPRDAEVVGVVADVREHITGGGLYPHVYVPFGQEYQANANIHLRTSVQGRDGQARLLEAVRREIREVDARLPVLALKSLRDHVDGSFDLWIARTGARMFAIFGAVALLLAMIGLYGVRAYTVARRTREIGIRMALGADARDTLRLILREGLVLTTIGVGAGLALSLALGKLLSSLLFEVSGVDPVVFSAAPVVLAAVSLLACYIPARRAAHVDPMVALRHD